ncbi:MAG: GNAT family N-acetyltransferase [Bacteroidetes bacterium]|uniref:GNAT family N-acetyltransferase n=1 Tax=Candidatus Cryptobacteroides intestinavium TaxID=2840766 RepID=A0A9D9EZB7_9BACT|nr:GNAT family N-acetyltransferase [Candidatus Cryptobacteroides intestinavium]
MEDNETIVRKAGPDDAESLVAIYSHYVENTAVSFEYVTPSVQEFRSRATASNFSIQQHIEEIMLR